MYRVMTEREATNPIGFVGLASKLTERGRLDEALPLLDRAERIDPALPSIQVGRARIATRGGDWDAVLAATGRALALDPEPAAHLLGGADAAEADDEAGRTRLVESVPGIPRSERCGAST
jgi:tetratricopeptide (TPR) repeat protein